MQEHSTPGGEAQAGTLGIRKTDPQYQEVLSRGKLWPLLYGTQAPSVGVRSGVVTLFAPHHVIEPESGASDDVTAFSGGQDGKVYLIRPASGKTITVKHGVDNIFMVGGADLTLDAAYDVAQVIFIRSLGQYIAWSFGSSAGSVPTHAHGDLYYTETEVDALFVVHEGDVDPHPGYLTPAEHTAIGDGSPHHAPESGTSGTHDHDGSYEPAGTVATHTADSDAHHAEVHTHTESDITDLDHDDTDAIHDNESGEIAAVTEKTTPVAADLVLIEDSAASNAKKRVQLGNLVKVGKVSKSFIFESAGDALTADDLIPQNSIRIPASGKHGTIVLGVAYARCETVGAGTNTILIETSTTLTGSRTTRGTINLGANREASSSDMAFTVSDGMYIWARCSAVDATAPQKVTVQVDATETVF